MSIVIKIDNSIYSNIRSHLLHNELEHVCFLYYRPLFDEQHIVMDVQDFYIVPSHEYDYQSEFHVVLSDACQSKVIKKAWDKKLSLGEIHSHPLSIKAAFSTSDMSGFQDFVPHVWWRLKKGPYFALVISQIEIDALAWIKSPKIEEAIKKIEVGNSMVYPSNNTLTQLKEEKWKKIFSVDNLISLGKMGRRN
jgi:hypothetical protein